MTDVETCIIFDAPFEGEPGLGVAFLSRFAIEAELKAKTLAAVKVKDFDVRRELRIVYRKDKHLNRAAKAFIETARAKPGLSTER